MNDKSESVARLNSTLIKRFDPNGPEETRQELISKAFDLAIRTADAIAKIGVYETDLEGLTEVRKLYEAQAALAINLSDCRRVRAALARIKAQLDRDGKRQKIKTSR
jgi:hypothetical protein